MTTIIN